MKSFENKNNWLTYALRFLLPYRTTPYATTGRTPSELLLGRTVRTRWDLLRPSSRDVAIKVQNQMRPAGKHRSFGIHDLVVLVIFDPGLIHVRRQEK